MNIGFLNRKIAIGGFTFALPVLALPVLAVSVVIGWSLVAVLRPEAPLPGPARPAGPAVTVDSFGTGAYSLERWSIDDSRTAGWIDNAALQPGSGLQVSGDDQILNIGGWAGETGLGIRSPTVVLTLCDLVVGAVPVGRPRPDVAATVHPNLKESGWQARLLIGHLPRCDGTYLEAWAVYPNGTVLLPLEGRIRLTLPPRNPALALDRFAVRPPVFPEPVARTRLITIEIDKIATTRRAPTLEAPALHRIGPGRYQADQLDERDDWLLLVVDGKGGWLPRGAIRISG